MPIRPVVGVRSRLRPRRCRSGPVHYPAENDSVRRMIGSDRAIGRWGAWWTVQAMVNAAAVVLVAQRVRVVRVQVGIDEQPLPTGPLIPQR
jgi:hypothetical protein